jgi:DNA invertase Pin-like site-specific DNA recombinase
VATFVDTNILLYAISTAEEEAEKRTIAFSRLGIDQTNVLLRRFLNDGVIVHITEENRAIRSLDDLLTVIMNAVQGFAAQEYTNKLRERIAKTWRSKREKITGPITQKCPAWLKVEDDHQYSVFIQ